MHPTTFGIEKMYPNPAAQRVRLQIQSPDIGSVQIQAIDIVGRMIWKGSVEPGTAGDVLDIRLPVGEWASGVYIIRVSQTGVGHTDRQMLVVAR